MINEAVKFLADQVDKFLSVKLTVPTTDARVVPGNIIKAFDADGATGSIANKAVVSLINIEEDRLSKQQLAYTRIDNRIVYKNPAVHLNLYLLFSVNLSNYMDALQWLRYIAQCFQYQNVFTPTQNPSLDPGIAKLIVDLYTLSYEQEKFVWSMLGGKSLPSVLYKVRMVTIDEGIPYANGEFITEIDLAFPAEGREPEHTGGGDGGEGIGFWTIGSDFRVS